MWRPLATYIWPDLRATYFLLLLEQQYISVFLRLSVSIKDKWITKTLHDNKKDDSSPSYSDKIEYDADGNGSNMAYSSKVAVEYKHHKVFVYVSRFYAPAIPSRVSLKMKVVVMVRYEGACPKKNHSKIKLWGINIRSLLLILAFGCLSAPIHFCKFNSSTEWLQVC